jgi:hypothetical protein
MKSFALPVLLTAVAALSLSVASKLPASLSWFQIKWRRDGTASDEMVGFNVKVSTGGRPYK